RAHGNAGERPRPRAPGEHVIAPQPGQVAQPGRGAGQAAGEEVHGDLPRPDRLLDHRLAVVGTRLAHFLPPKTAAVKPTPSASAAAPAAAQISPRSRRVSTGSGGSPYTSGSSRSRKNAPAPPMPSSASAR